MASYYSVVQYYPNPLNGERINIGVLAYAGDSSLSRFIDNWDRVNAFDGGRGNSFLREFINEDIKNSLTEAQIRKMAANWANSIQLTPPRASLLTMEELLESVSETFLS